MSWISYVIGGDILVLVCLYIWMSYDNMVIEGGEL
jgi:hypothetical protein